jgi:ABC-type glycerol-3-phosphate transport system substrate-binding protein
LVKTNRYNAVFIEGDKVKYNNLIRTAEKFPNIIPIQAYVDHNDTSNSLDNILKQTNIPNDFDILSIDIDSYDFQVWKSLNNYKPKIVIIEINSSAKVNDSKYIHKPGKYLGTGFNPTYYLGIEKGYKFILHTGNMFFIRSDLFDKLGITYNNPLENFRTDWGGAI